MKIDGSTKHRMINSSLLLIAIVALILNFVKDEHSIEVCQDKLYEHITGKKGMLNE